MKSRYAQIPLLLCGALVILFLFGGCARSRVATLEREDLFRLPIGRAEDQIDLFQMEGAPLNQKTRLVMREGLFFISNGSANKVMEFNSYGDLLSLHYDPEENPRPVLLQTSVAEGRITNRRAHAYNFSQVGDIAVTRNKTILVEDMLGDERAVFDSELGVNLNRVVLRFDSRGQLIDYLGQEGIGGTPFPYIERLEVTGSDEIVVVSRTMESWLVYWFTAAGDLHYSVDIGLSRLPVPEGRDVIPILETVLPDKDYPRLYLKLDYYEQSLDSETGASFGIEKTLSRVFWLNLETGRYEGYVNLPRNSQTISGHSVFDRQEVEYMYQLVGVAPGEHLYLLSREDNDQSQLLIMRTDGRVVRRRNLHVEDSEIFYKTYHVSSTGVLSALLGFEDHARIIWWRSDRMVGDLTR